MVFTLFRSVMHHAAPVARESLDLSQIALRIPEKPTRVLR
jgi:hypothetical protein